MTINIENEYEGEFKDFLSEAEYTQIAENVITAAIDHEECPYDVDVNLLLTDDDEIHQINLEQRQMDKSTDVLSFPMCEYEAPADFDGFDDIDDYFHPETGELLLGDIVISVDHVVHQAEEYGHDVRREFAFLIAHSMLHLMGYDHMVTEDADEMFRRQEEILTGLGYVR